MNIFSQKNNSFGLDISDLSLKIVKLKKIRGNLELASFGNFKIPAGIIQDGEIKNKKRLARVVEKSLREVKGEKIKTKYIVLSLPEEKSFLDVLQMPLLEGEELETAVRFEVGRNIPLPLDEVYFDFEKVKPSSQHPKYQEVLVAATPKKIADPYLDVLKIIGLKPRALEIESLPIIRALIKKDVFLPPTLIIDFGETRVSFIIYSGKSLRFTTTIPISSQGLTENIAKALKISRKEAEILKRKEGLEGNKKVFDAMVPALSDLSEQVQIYLDYYHSHIPKNQLLHDGKNLEKIILCGGGSLIKGLVGFLTSALKIEVQLGNPWINIFNGPLKKIPGLPFRESLSYTTALGLALRDMEV